MLDISEKAFVLGMATLLFILFMVLVRGAFNIAQTRLKVNAETAANKTCRKLAEEAAAQQNLISNDISDIRERIAKIEQLLREVE